MPAKKVNTVQDVIWGNKSVEANARLLPPSRGPNSSDPEWNELVDTLQDPTIGHHHDGVDSRAVFGTNSNSSGVQGGAGEQTSSTTYVSTHIGLSFSVNNTAKLWGVGYISLSQNSGINRQEGVAVYRSTIGIPPLDTPPNVGDVPVFDSSAGVMTGVFTFIPFNFKDINITIGVNYFYYLAVKSSSGTVTITVGEACLTVEEF